MKKKKQKYVKQIKPHKKKIINVQCCIFFTNRAKKNKHRNNIDFRELRKKNKKKMMIIFTFINLVSKRRKKRKTKKTHIYHGKLRIFFKGNVLALAAYLNCVSILEANLSYNYL